MCKRGKREPYSPAQRNSANAKAALLPSLESILEGLGHVGLDKDLKTSFPIDRHTEQGGGCFSKGHTAYRVPHRHFTISDLLTHLSTSSAQKSVMLNSASLHFQTSESANGSATLFARAFASHCTQRILCWLPGRLRGRLLLPSLLLLDFRVP